MSVVGFNILAQSAVSIIFNFIYVIFYLYFPDWLSFDRLVIKLLFILSQFSFRTVEPKHQFDGSGNDFVHLAYNASSKFYLV